MWRTVGGALFRFVRPDFTQQSPLPRWSMGSILALTRSQTMPSVKDALGYGPDEFSACGGALEFDNRAHAHDHSEH